MKVFRSIAKDQRPVIAKDFNNFFDSLDRNDRNAKKTSSFSSKGVSPSKASVKDHKPRNTMTQPP